MLRILSLVASRYLLAGTVLLCCAVLRCAALRCAVLCCAVPCCAVLCRAVLCWAVLCWAVPCWAVPCCAVPCRAVLCRAVLCCAVPCCAVPCRAVLCRAMLCCAMLYCAMLCFTASSLPLASVLADVSQDTCRNSDTLLGYLHTYVDIWLLTCLFLPCWYFSCCWDLVTNSLARPQAATLTLCTGVPLHVACMWPAICV